MGLNIKLIEWTGSVPSQEDLVLHIEYVKNYELSRVSRKALGWMESKLFDVLVRHSHPENLLFFLKNVRILKVPSLGINKKIAYVNYVKLHSDFEKGLHEFYNPRRASLSILEKLKFKTQAGFAA